MKLKWQKEYINGLGHEIYRTKLSLRYERNKFSSVAGQIYKEFGAILFGLELTIDKSALIILNPGDFEIPDILSNYVSFFNFQFFQIYREFESN